MSKLLKNLLVTVLLVAGLVMPAAGFGMQLPELVEAREKYEQTLDERQGIVERLDQLEDQHQSLVQKIDQLKSSGAMSTIGGRIELQNLLSKSKSLADELDSLQDRIRSLDNRLAGQRSTLVAGIDRQVRELESKLAGASTAERKRIVRRLNGLRQQRGAYTTPLPSVPSSGQVDSALRLAEEVSDHPEELRAAADEMQDTEDQLRKRLDAIDEKLSELRNSRALVRRARSFSREEKFFEETDRDRVIARYDRETRTRQDDGANNQEPPQDSQNNGGVAVGGAEDDFSANNAAGDDSLNEGSMAPTSDADFAADPGRSADPEISDAPTGAEVAEPTPSGSDPFETSRETVVIDGGGDPERSVGSLDSGDRDLDSRIEKLEREREKLRRKANELQSRASELRQRAEEL
jgi:phage shock protein A